ncbi:hypothetical protein F5B20DRAFT_563518 [Whalleya microplaca]|nr:hypothetical protein F5B20DRAFT_563518 [Whalleya microplaca]
MEAPLRRLAEGYPEFSFNGFPSVPGLLNRIESALPNQSPTPAPPGSRLWGVSYILFRTVTKYVLLVECAVCVLDYDGKYRRKLTCMLQYTTVKISAWTRLYCLDVRMLYFDSTAMDTDYPAT